MAGSQHSILFVLTLVAYGSSVYTGLVLKGSGKIDKSHDQNCSKGLVWQSRTGVCCEPYFNCPQGYGITECTVNGEPDLCQKCPDGQNQTNMVSSLNMDEAHCFSPNHTEICPEDTKLSRRYPSDSSCIQQCECKNDDCYHGENSCLCVGPNSPCGAGETMNRTTGECEKCPWFAYKLNNGCGPCLVNASLWRQGQPDPTVAITTTTSSTKGQSSTTIAQSTPEPKVALDIAKEATIEGRGPASELNYPMTITVIIIVASVVIVLIVIGPICLAFVLLRTGSCNLGGRNQTSIHTPIAPYTTIEQRDKDHSKDGVDNGCFQCGEAGREDVTRPLLHTVNETDSPSPDQGLNAAVKLQHSELQLTQVPSSNLHPNREPTREQGQARPVGKVVPMCRAQSTLEPGRTVDAVNRSVSEGDNPSSIDNASMGYAVVNQVEPLSTLGQRLGSELDRNQSFSNGIYEDESIIYPSEINGEPVGPRHTQNTSEIRNPGNDEEETLLKTPYPETIPKVIDDGHVLRSNESPRMCEIKEFNLSASDRDSDLVVKKGEESDTKNTNTKTSDTKGQPAKVTNTEGDDQKQGTNVHTELSGSGSAGYTALGSEVNGESINMDEIADVSLAGVDLSDRFLDSTGPQAMRHTGNQTEPEQARGEHSNLSIELSRNDSDELSQEEIDSLNRKCHDFHRNGVKSGKKISEC